MQDLPEEIAYELRRHSTETDRLSEEFATIHLLSRSDVRALVLLLDAGRAGRHVAAVDLSRALAMSPAAITGMVDRLEHRGFLTRTAHPTDRRKTLLEVTDLTRQAGWKFFGTLHLQMVAAMAPMPDGDLQLIHRFLSTMTDLVVNHRSAQLPR